MNSYRRGPRNGVLVNLKLFLLKKVKLGQLGQTWSTWSNSYYLVRVVTVDIPDEKFAITTFMVGLGVQSKDLMFSISKNPQVSMAEVLAKTKKYFNGEEALLSNQRSSSTQKEKSRGDKKRERSLRRQTDKDRSLRRNRENRERSPKRRGNVRDRLGPPQPDLKQRYAPRQFTPLDGLSIAGPTRGATLKISEMAIPDEVRPNNKRRHQILRVPQGSWTPNRRLHPAKERN